MHQTMCAPRAGRRTRGGARLFEGFREAGGGY
jgi:hypothetical protein